MKKLLVAFVVVGLVSVASGGDCPGLGGECCVPGGNGTPGCDDLDCCALICAQDLFCCAKQWDGICADLACELCQNCSCPPGGDCCDGAETPEGEACAEDGSAEINGGCNSAPPGFTSAACGDVFCGSAWALDGERDTDWYAVIMHDPVTTLSVTLESSFPGAVVIVDGIDVCEPVGIGQFGVSLLCIPGTASADVPPGHYGIWAVPTTHQGVACGGGETKYRLTINCEAGAPPDNDLCTSRSTVGLGSNEFPTVGATGPDADPGCGNMDSDIWFDFSPADSGTYSLSTFGSGFGVDTALAIWADACCKEDVDSDGLVGVTDLVAVILDWGCAGLPGTCTGDVDGDGEVGVTDLVAVILSWGPCPACPGAELIACNDDVGGPNKIYSEIVFAATAGECYKIQLGGPASPQWTGVLTITRR